MQTATNKLLPGNDARLLSVPDCVAAGQCALCYLRLAATGPQWLIEVRTPQIAARRHPPARSAQLDEGGKVATIECLVATITLSISQVLTQRELRRRASYRGKWPRALHFVSSRGIRM